MPETPQNLADERRRAEDRRRADRKGKYDRRRNRCLNCAHFLSPPEPGEAGQCGIHHTEVTADTFACPVFEPPLSE